MTENNNRKVRESLLCRRSNNTTTVAVSMLKSSQCLYSSPLAVPAKMLKLKQNLKNKNSTTLIIDSVKQLEPSLV